MRVDRGSVGGRWLKRVSMFGTTSEGICGGNVVDNNIRTEVEGVGSRSCRGRVSNCWRASRTTCGVLLLGYFRPLPIHSDATQ